MKLRLITAAALFVSGIAYAQTGQLAVGVGAHIQPIPHAPFSAEVHSDLNRVLADGNRIHEEWQEKLYRDSEGRTRSERTRVLPAPEKTDFSSVVIHDPVQKVDIFLDQRRKVATVHHYPEPKRTNPEPASAPREIPALPHSEPHIRNLDENSTRTGPDGRIIKTEKLGTKEIDGLSANGTKTTITIPAGVEGNSEPIITVRESWFSHELKLDLVSTSDDPRSGQTTKTVENIQRGDPDPLLFQVPADYTVKDEKVQTESGATYDSANPQAK
ncbi:MAG: hypothetical protein ABSD20_06905 [Terriglobales bacterium]|jgi:hypothetical protein